MMTKSHEGPRSWVQGPCAAGQLLLAAVVLLDLGPRTQDLRAQLGSFNPAPGPRGVYVIRNARIVPVSGPEIARGTVVIGPDGRIQAVGADVTVPSGAQVIDASGLTVYPGMMDAGSSMGLSEIPQANATVDVAEVGSFNPNAQALWGINPHSAHIGVTRVVGVTHVLSSPSGGLISGQSAVINLAGWTAPDMTVLPKAALVINLPRAGFSFGRSGFQALMARIQQGGESDPDRVRDRQMDSIRTILRDAEAYGRAIDAYERDRSLPRPQHDVVLASLVAAVRGQMPVLFTAERAADIRAAINFAREMKLKPVILGGRDAWQVTDLLKQNDVPVILTSVMDLPSREDDPYDVNFSAPSKLHRAGVRFAIASGDQGAEVRNLPYTAGMAAAFGLPKEAALRAVTLAPAEILSVSDRLGTIEVGKMANLVVTDGDLLEARTKTRHLFIDGRPIPLSTKHEVLYETFKNRKGE
jgi:imidazolonepropionase-like amidohydrolase